LSKNKEIISVSVDKDIKEYLKERNINISAQINELLNDFVVAGNNESAVDKRISMIENKIQGKTGTKSKKTKRKNDNGP